MSALEKTNLGGSRKARWVLFAMFVLVLPAIWSPATNPFGKRHPELVAGKRFPGEDTPVTPASRYTSQTGTILVENDYGELLSGERPFQRTVAGFARIQETVTG